MLDDQELTEKTFVMWDIIHDRTHMRGDLPFDPFMIKQRMPYFLYPRTPDQRGSTTPAARAG